MIIESLNSFALEFVNIAKFLFFNLSNIAPAIILIAGFIYSDNQLKIIGVLFSANLAPIIPSDIYHLYYIFCAAISLAALEVSESSKSINKTVKSAIKTFIYLNLLGFIWWISYVKYAWLYNLLCLVNYSFIIWFVFKDHDGTFRKRRRNHRANKLRRDNDPPLFYTPKTETKN